MMKVMLKMLAIVVALFFGFLLLEDHLQRRTCHKVGRQTGREVHYPDHLNLDEGCFIKSDQGWVPLKNWRQ